MTTKSIKRMSVHTLVATSLLAWGMCLTAGAAENSVSMKPFGKIPSGEKVDLYTLTNQNGMSVSLATYGATVINLKVPDRTGKLADIALGFSSITPYPAKSDYFGAIVGRYGNRIAHGKFTLEGKSYRLAKNCQNVSALHGGIKGFDKQIWKGEILKSAQPSVRFSLHSPDGQEGYPGNLDVAVTYTLTDKNELAISYRGKTDKPTVINLTNHTYFNLAGAGNGSILDHQLKINASRYTPVAPSLIPTGELKKVEGTPFDFRKATVIGAGIKAAGGNPVGYDHNFVLNKSIKGLFNNRTLAAEVYEPKSGRLMTVYTDQPGIQFYTGNFLNGTITGKGGKVYNQYGAFCLETQHYPDSPNQPSFPSTELKPGQTYKTSTVYKFSAK
jgi:aldose 1-epimerase